MFSRRCHYMLRYTLVPKRKEKESIERLKKFCVANRIAEVIFFINAEELNQGHLSIEETKVWLDVILRAKRELAKENIIISLNPWHTLLHCDRGRKLKSTQKFQLMVDYQGNQANCCVCPLDENWQKYIFEIFQLYASIKPNIIWVDDDFRYHNHEPLEWGGCFCDLHLKEMARRIGKRLTRKELVRSILKPGKPHPYRKIWLDLLGESFINLASLLEKAVHSISPDTKIGLMCSDPIVHSAEGRKWKELLSAFSGGDQLILRPHVPAYQEIPGVGLFHFAITRHTIACVPKTTRICPEIENFPYTRYSKSVKQTMTQILLSQLTGAKDITLNLFDFMGNGIESEPDYGTALGKNKHYFDEVANLFSEKKKERGVRIIFNPQASYAVQTEIGKNLEELYSQDRGWAVNLSALGISYYFDAQTEGEVNAISGAQVLAMDSKEILSLLKKGLLLDGTAAYYLYQMGYGDLIGLKNTQWLKLEEAGFSYEEIVNQGLAPLGAHMTAQAVSKRIVNLEIMNKGLIASQIYTADRKIHWVGSYLYRNRLGGRVAVLCYPLTNNGNIAFLNRYRQQMIQNILIWLSNNKEYLCFVQNQPLIYTSRVDFDNYYVLSFLNFSTDLINEIQVYLENFPVKLKKCWFLNKKGTWKAFKLKLVKQLEGKGVIFRILYPLNYLNSFILKCPLSEGANEHKEKS